MIARNVSLGRWAFPIRRRWFIIHTTECELGCFKAMSNRVTDVWNSFSKDMSRFEIRSLLLLALNVRKSSKFWVIWGFLRSMHGFCRRQSVQSICRRRALNSSGIFWSPAEYVYTYIYIDIHIYIRYWLFLKLDNLKSHCLKLYWPHRVVRKPAVVDMLKLLK